MNETSFPIPTRPYLLLDPARPFIHRDLSWIQFNERVLAESRAKRNPLLERLKFLSISASNLDEFFMIRFASIVRKASTAKQPEDRGNAARIQSTVLESVRRFTDKQVRSLKFLRKEASAKGIHLHLKCPKDSDAYRMGREIFVKEILPQLQPRASFHPAAVSELQNLQLLVYINQDIYFEIPKKLPPVFWKALEDTEEAHVFFLDDLLLSHLDHMLPIKDRPGILRVTRDADFTLELPEGDSESIPDLVKRTLGSREKGRLVRLQYTGNFPKDFLDSIGTACRADTRQILKAPMSLCLHGLFGFVQDLPEYISRKKAFSHPPLPASVPPQFKEKKKLFSALRERDFMLHHPYDAFDAFLLWLEAAAEDPEVIMIEQTIYRTDSVSRIVEILKKASARKKVRVALELRARFDEWNNLQIAEELAKAGAEVKFGFGNLKLHAKITLVTRKEGEQIKRYTHLSTGNYSARNARAYTDIAILTANEEIGEDARHFFDSILKNHAPSTFKRLVVAPTKLHLKVKALIKAETEAARAGKPAKIVAKVNALVDDKIIDDLYAASQAGVKVDLIVRGACSLIPGVQGLSENIRVFSIVDRFLEHSRIYYFENSETVYLSSADWMPRNFFSRLEIAFPVLDKRLYEFITKFLLPGYLRDNVKARRLNSKGVWERLSNPKDPHRAQEYFSQLAYRGYIGTPLNPENR